jgi:hypothetical protein
MEPVECGHAPCSCHVAEGGAFCSGRCAQLHDAGARQACLCGHAGCSGASEGRAIAGAEDESTDSDADASLGPGDPSRRGGTRER